MLGIIAMCIVIAFVILVVVLIAGVTKRNNEHINDDILNNDKIPFI